MVSLRGCKFQPVPLRPLLGSGSPVALGQVKFALSVISTDSSFLKDRDREPALTLRTYFLELQEGHSISFFYWGHFLISSAQGLSVVYPMMVIMTRMRVTDTDGVPTKRQALCPSLYISFSLPR